jgi:hypothetical protein
MEWLATRENVIALALLGAVLSTAASLLQVRKIVSEKNAMLMHYAGYGAMGLSMLLFIVAGFRGST